MGGKYGREIMVNMGGKSPLNENHSLYKFQEVFMTMSYVTEEVNITLNL